MWSCGVTAGWIKCALHWKSQKYAADDQGWGGGVCAVTGAANASGERQGRPKLRQLVQKSWSKTFGG